MICVYVVSVHGICSLDPRPFPCQAEKPPLTGEKGGHSTATGRSADRSRCPDGSNDRCAWIWSEGFR